MKKKQRQSGRSHVIKRVIEDYLRACPVMKLSDGDACPCGSIRRYGDCCGPKGVEYRLLWANESGEPALIDSRTFREKATELLMYLDRPWVRGISSLSQGLRYLEGLYRRYDSFVALFERFVSCRRGCTACCYYLVGTSFLEAELIKRYAVRLLSQEQLDAIRVRVREQLAYYIRENQRPRDRQKDEELLAAYFQKRLPCPFLSAENDCMVYPVRPFTCRSHSAVSDPHACETGKGLDLLDVMGLTTSIATALVELCATYFGDERWEHLGLWLAF